MSAQARPQLRVQRDAGLRARRDADHCLRPAVFLDRDGVINVRAAPHCYVRSPEELTILPNAAEGIRLLKAHDFLVIVATNQAGVGRGVMGLEELHLVHEALQQELARRGAVVDAIYYCPHAPTAGCDCRKPKTGLLRHAARELAVDLGQSFMVGDSLGDLMAGRRAGCTAILVGTGDVEDVRGEEAALAVLADHVAADLARAAGIVVQVASQSHRRHTRVKRGEAR
ncbi:MAG: D-glycero-alpha-D-manno-heptose-1,7-bisphosphate 7-phosphatase [Armatimonadota bacterium]